jgi:hypothetical protein
VFWDPAGEKILKNPQKLPARIKYLIYVILSAIEPILAFIQFAIKQNDVDKSNYGQPERFFSIDESPLTLATQISKQNEGLVLKVCQAFDFQICLICPLIDRLEPKIIFVWSKTYLM